MPPAAGLEPPVRVLYIAGMWHNGSTIAGNILGGADGIFFAGEVRYLFRQSVLNQLCGCGQTIAECPVWTRIDAGIDFEHSMALERRVTRARDLPRILAALRGHGPLAADVLELVGTLGTLYRSIAGVTGCRLVVDSSKSPLYASLLSRVPGVELSVLHLVRDPRGFAWSNLKRGPKADVGAAQGAILWDLFQLYGETWGRNSRYLCVRYEDLARRPEETLQRALKLTGVEATLPLTASGEALIEPSHSARGNAGRFRSGRIPIRPDEDWRERLPAREFSLVTALTWPLLLHYGYGLRRR